MYIIFYIIYYSVGITFGAGSHHFIEEPTDSLYECALAPDEYITEVTLYAYMLFGTIPIQAGIKLVTSSKVCGPYGYSAGEGTTFKGNRLLYVYGRLGMSFDQLAFVFERCN